MARYIQDPKTGKLVPAHEYQRETNDGAFIQGDIESFVSPIDGSVISDRGQLRRHMAAHGVTDSRDYSHDYYVKKAKERDASMTGSKAERLDEIQRTLHNFGY